MARGVDSTAGPTCWEHHTRPAGRGQRPRGGLTALDCCRYRAGSLIEKLGLVTPRAARPGAFARCFLPGSLFACDSGVPPPGLHHDSAPAESPRGRSSAGESCSGASRPSLVAYLTIRDRRRRSRSWASGPGLEKTRTTPMSGVSPPGFRFRFCSFLSLSFIYLSRATPSRISALSRVVW